MANEQSCALGISVMPAPSDNFKNQFEEYVASFQSTADLALKGAATNFRTSANVESLNKAISALGATFADLDTFVDKASPGKELGVQADVDTDRAAQLAKTITTKIDAIKGMIPIVEGLDEKVILTKTATLDRKNLNDVAKQLKTIDATFVENIETMSPTHKEDDVPQQHWDMQRMDADGSNIPNVPEPDAGEEI
jgi:hypothetical protein